VWGLGVRGEGIVVANIDMGVQYDHRALYRQYRGYLSSDNYDHNYNWFDPYHQGSKGGRIPEDVNGHGTHTMGIMVGEDQAKQNQIGMAPGAKWIACDGGDNASGLLFTNELLECAQWILAPWDLDGNHPDPAKRPHIVNNSWGGGQGDYWYTDAVAAWRAAGIFPAFSNGNDGPGCFTAGSPGDNGNVFSSGATNNNDIIASFSGRGPALNTNTLKPNITAPGVDIRSSIPTSSHYGNLSGTSMASPHTAGAVALLWSADPELIGQIDLTGWLLERSAKPLFTNEGCGGNTTTSRPHPYV
jgi:subtilisin family serine protease